MEAKWSVHIVAHVGLELDNREKYQTNIGVDAINIKQYKIMLKNVWTSKEVDPEQLERLKMLRETMNISEELHRQLEAEIKAEFFESTRPSKIAPEVFNVLIKESIKTSKPRKKQKNKSDKLKRIKLKKIITLANEKYSNKEYEDALQLLKQGSELDSENPEILFYIKKVNLKLRSSKSGSKNISEDKSTGDLVTHRKDENTGINIKEKITTPRFAQKRTEVKPAIPVGHLNGASVETLEKTSETASNLDTPKTTEPETTLGKMVEDENILKDETKRFTLDKPDKTKCISCNGTGKCYWCSGSGKCDRCGGDGVYNDSNCTMCNGTGKCNSCSGQGTCMWCRGKGTSRQMNTLFTMK